MRIQTVTPEVEAAVLAEARLARRLTLKAIALRYRVTERWVRRAIARSRNIEPTSR